MSTVHNFSLPTSNNEHFDLHDYTAGLLSHFVAAQIAQSTAWRIDTILVASTRALFKELRAAHQEQNPDSAALVNDLFKEAQFAEDTFKLFGSPHTGVCETIRALYAQRDQWHDLAQELTNFNNDFANPARDYKIPDIEEVFFKEPSFKVAPSAQRRLKVSAVKYAEAFGGDKAMADRIFERKAQRAKDNLQDMAEALKDQAPALFTMFRIVLRADDSSAAVRSKAFYSLPTPVQVTLLENATAAAARADDFASSNRLLTDAEYDVILAQSIKTQLDLKRVLSAPRFTRAATAA